MLNLMCPINQLGYGVVGQNLAVNLDCFVKPIGDKRSLSCEKKNQAAIQEKLNNHYFHYDAPCIRVWHQHDMSEFIGGLKIGFPIFELDRFSDLEKYHLNYCERLFVCSNWAKEVCERELNNPDVRVIPLGVDREIFAEKNRVGIAGKTIFLTCGKWERRKAHDKIIQAFNMFDDEDVELWMICDNPFLSGEQTNRWLSLVANSKLTRQIKIIPRQESQHDIARLMNMATCGVFPALAEGWNLELLEMMSCNRPVITTNYSAHTEYCNNDNAFLIEIDETEPAYDEPFFNGQGEWAKFGESQVRQLFSHMKFIHENNIRDNPNGVQTAKKYSWENTCQEIYGNL